MDGTTLVGAALLGLLEGLTEFIPVSSTAHLLLAGHFLGFESTGKTFEVLIQLGAIMAILTVYFTRLWQMAIALPTDRKTQHFVAGILLAFLPAAVIGALAHGFIKTVLFETPLLICIVLIVGGFILLWIDRLPLKPRYTDVTEYPLGLCLQDRPVPVPGDDPGHVTVRLDDRRRAADGNGQALGGGVFVLSRHADHGRRVHARSLQELRQAGHG
jgi:undecaprenyl-diphosphatase